MLGIIHRTGRTGEMKNVVDRPAIERLVDVMLPEFESRLVPRKQGEVQLTANERRALTSLGYVGGGCLGRCGEPRLLDEGTFGWDYDCGWRPGRVFLNWCHCGKSPKLGPYKTNGPNAPDVFSVHPVKKALGEKSHREVDH